MRVAVVVPAAGSPSTLATTAFIGALMEGFSAVRIEARVLGLTLDTAEWVPEALGPCETGAPWLPPTQYRLGDRAEAMRRGIFAPSADGCDKSDSIRWRLELSLERELLDFAPDGLDNAVLADTRSLPLLRLVCRVANRLGWKVVVVSNEALTDLQIDPATRDDYVGCVIHCTEGVWAFSDYLADYWKSLGVSDERVFVSPPVVRPTSFARQAPARGSTHAAYLGNLAHREIDYLLDISEAVVAQVPEFKLTIYGDACVDVRAALAETIRKRGLAGVIAIEPPVSPTAVPEVLGRADVLLLPRSRGEFSAAGFPNKLGEYLASGRPVVITRVGDIPKHLTDGESAFLVEPDDNNAFAAAVVRVLGEPELADAVGAEGRRLAETTLGGDIVAARLASWIESLPRAAECQTAVGNSGPLWRRLGVLRPDPELTRRDISLLIHALRRKMG